MADRALFCLLGCQEQMLSGSASQSFVEAIFGQQEQLNDDQSSVPMLANL